MNEKRPASITRRACKGWVSNYLVGVTLIGVGCAVVVITGAPGRFGSRFETDGPQHEESANSDAVAMVRVMDVFIGNQ